jgi:hypothetical protein
MPKIGMRTKQPSLSALTRNAGHTQMKLIPLPEIELTH